MEQRFYFDTNALLKYYCPLLRREEEGVLQIRRLVSNSLHSVLISPLTTLEFVNKLIYFYHCNTLKRGNIHRTVAHLQQDIGVNKHTKPFSIVTLPEGVFHLAERILLEHTSLSLGSNDALHLAIVQQHPFKPIMVTSDNIMKKVCERKQIPFYDPLTT